MTLTLLSLGVSLDDFALAFALSLLIPSETVERKLFTAGKMALAFSVSTALLPLIGWLVGIALFDLIASFGAWIVLFVFCGVGAWMIKEAFEDESPRWVKKNIGSFWVLLGMGALGSIDEGAVGVGYPFLSVPIHWIILSVILVNTAFIFAAVFLSGWRKNLDKRIPSLLSGILLVVLGAVNFLKLFF